MEYDIDTIGFNNPYIKKLRKHKRKFSENDFFTIEEIGIFEILLTELPQKKFVVSALLICQELCKSKYALALFHEFQGYAKKVFRISEETFRSITSKKNSAGLFAVLEKDSSELKKGLRNEYKSIIVLDGLESPGNIGTIFRTADATGTDCIVLNNCTPKINNPKIISSSRGTVFSVPFLITTGNEMVRELDRKRYKIFLCEPSEGTPYYDIDYDCKKALVFGSERFGVNKAWLLGEHVNIFIPMQGLMTSLNVSVAASIIMYQARITR